MFGPCPGQWAAGEDGACEDGTIESGIMQAAGDKWTIEVMPGGISHSDNPGEEAQRCSELVAIFLRYKGDSEAIRVKFSITLVNQLPGKADGTSKADGADNDVVVTFATGMGFPTFVKRCELEDESNGFKLNDRVIFRATITTIGRIGSLPGAHSRMKIGDSPHKIYMLCGI